MSSTPQGTAREVLSAFLRLGLTSFGGPIAHIGYFRREFVERRRWLDEAQFAQLLAIAQVLPGPASSQLGFSLGLLRAGLRGAAAAFVAFTLPSVLLLLGLAGLMSRSQTGIGAPLMHGLKLATVAVVAHGVWQMGRRMTTDARHVGIAAAAAVAMLVGAQPWLQLVVIAVAAMAGRWMPTAGEAPTVTGLPTMVSRTCGKSALALAALLLAVALAAPLVSALGGTTRATATPDPAANLFTLGAAFWRAGSLVFGGGHVVLPLLEQSVVASGWLPLETFLAGYGAAQAIPGPMFSLAAFLGASVGTGASPWLGATVATLGIFLPGFLLVIGVLPIWGRFAGAPTAQRSVAAINAAVVGLLAAALLDPILRVGVESPLDALLALAALLLLRDARRSPLWAVALCTLGSVALGALGFR